VPKDGRPPERVSLAIVGGGPAGLAAAIEAKKNGVSDVVILEREKEAGGILGQCIHPGFGLHLFGEELTGPEYATRFVREAAEWEIPVYTDTMVLSLSNDRHITAISGAYGHFTLQADAVVLAMGCRERAAGALSIPGARPAGIMTAGSAQRFINMEGYLPGQRVVILGSGDIGLIMARRLTLEGAKVEMVCEVMPYSGGLTRNIVQCLDDFDIPLKLSHTVVGLHGRERLTGVTVAQVDEHRKPIPGTEFDVACDTLLLSVGLIPENELSRAAGVPIDDITGGPVVSMDMQTGVPGIFACGNVVHVHDLVDNVSEEARLAGRCAARWLAKGGVLQRADGADVMPGELAGAQADGDAMAAAREIPVLAGEGIRYVLPKVVRMDGIEPESRLLLRVTAPQRQVTLEVRAGTQVLVSQRKIRVTPGEMEAVPLKPEWLARVPLGGALSVHIVPRKPASPVPPKDVRDISCFVLDMDGTFYLGEQLLPTSHGFLEKLAASGRRFLFFTNNSSKSPEDYLAKLARLGVNISPDQMMTSGDVAISFLQRERPGKSVFLLGTPSLRTQFRQAGIPLVEPVAGWAPSKDNPVADIVMVAFDTTLAYDALSQACWHIREGAEFLATHPDWNCPVEGGFIPDCGAMCALVEASAGRKPRFLGKPYPETMAAVLERTGAVRAQVAFVGDRLYTDVATGVNNGASGILVLTGEAGEADIAASEVKPTWVYPSLKELGEALGQPEEKKTQGQPEDKKAQGQPEDKKAQGGAGA
jgi:HAD superfamily hydrolase (TIGR01450 family)